MGLSAILFVVRDFVWKFGLADQNVRLQTFEDSLPPFLETGERNTFDRVGIYSTGLFSL